MEPGLVHDNYMGQTRIEALLMMMSWSRGDPQIWWRRRSLMQLLRYPIENVFWRGSRLLGNLICSGAVHLLAELAVRSRSFDWTSCSVSISSCHLLRLGSSGRRGFALCLHDDTFLQKKYGRFVFLELRKLCWCMFWKIAQKVKDFIDAFHLPSLI